MHSPGLESQGCHLIPLSYLLLVFVCHVLLLFPFCHFYLLMVHSPDFIPEHSQTFFVKSQAFCVALVEQLASTWHWYLPSCISINFLFKFCCCFCSFLSLFSFLFRCCCLLILVSISYTEWSTILACAILMYSFNRGTIEESKSWQKFVFDVLCMYTLLLFFMFVQGLVLQIDLRKVLHMRKVLKCACFYDGV